MEKFKVLEKETKTKAFSKEGLSKGLKKKKDPKANPKYPTMKWIDRSAQRGWPVAALAADAFVRCSACSTSCATRYGPVRCARPRCGLTQSAAAVPAGG
jgi:hypothetical protein